MMINTDKTYKHILFCGDIHGNGDTIPNYIRDNELDTCAVFQAGDFGIGFEREHKDQKWLKYINERMKHSNSDLFVVRGNHDKPTYFDGNTILSNLTLLKDYTVININGWNVLGIGGAISVDRKNRKGYWYPNKNDYWKDEIVVLDEDKLNELRDIDIVVTHSAPNFCNPLTKSNIQSWMNNDNDLELDLTIERHLLSIMYEILSKNNNICDWYYGHFHFNSKSYNDNTTFHALDIDTLVNNRIIYNNNNN